MRHFVASLTRRPATVAQRHNPDKPTGDPPYTANRYARLVLNLGRALLNVGSPAHRLESAMQIMAERLGLKSEFFSTPTALIVNLGDGEQQQTFLARAEPGS